MWKNLPKWARYLLIVVVVIIAANAAWSAAFASGTWRYKMTVTVETPEGLKTGSAVREVYVARGLKITPESLPHVKVTGEAVVLTSAQVDRSLPCCAVAPVVLPMLMLFFIKPCPYLMAVVR